MKTICYLLLLVALLGAGGCSNKDVAIPVTNVDASKPFAWTAGYDIYVVGMDSGHACYWKSGVKTSFTNSSEGMGIAVAGSDVYVAGAVFLPGRAIAAYWKNGVETDLSDSESLAYQVTVSGSDVYIPGVVEGPLPHINAVYWKNGQAVRLDTALLSFAAGIAVSGSDVYVMGSVTNAVESPETYLIWKNGMRVPGSYSTGLGSYSQILFAGQDLYVVGLQGYFVEGRGFVALPEATQTASMSISGSDIYVTGNMVENDGTSHAVYWKNGQLIALPDAAAASSWATGIAIAGTDVYVTGTAIINKVSTGVFWKNGIMAGLSPGGAANQILVR